jgi:hypothetical protein
LRADLIVTAVRQRVARDCWAGAARSPIRVADPVLWNRLLLLTAAEHLSSRQWNGSVPCSTTATHRELGPPGV